MIKWPDRQAVVGALQTWAQAVVQETPGISKVGYFGSYARGDWGVGSDLDVLLLVRKADRPFEQRAAAYDTTSLPVPVDLLVYTEAEWARLQEQGGFFKAQEIVWVYG